MSIRLWGITLGIWLSTHWLGSCHQRPGFQGNHPSSPPVLSRFLLLSTLLHSPSLFLLKGQVLATSCACNCMCVCVYLHVHVCMRVRLRVWGCVSNSVFVLSVMQSGHCLPWWWIVMPICRKSSQQVCQYWAGKTEFLNLPLTFYLPSFPPFSFLQSSFPPQTVFLIHFPSMFLFPHFLFFSLSTPMPSLFHYRYIFTLLSTVFMLYVFTSIFSSLASVSPTWFHVLNLLLPSTFSSTPLPPPCHSCTLTFCVTSFSYSSLFLLICRRWKKEICRKMEIRLRLWQQP